MKIIGLIGGISWVSTIDYYRAINLGVNESLGGSNFSECMIYSFNYQDIITNNVTGNQEATFGMLLKGSTHLKNGGAKAIVLCANTMHLHAERLEQAIGIPVIHIARATAKAIEKKGLKKVGLLGTTFTMELDFFKDKLKERGIEVLIPDKESRQFIQHTIFYELGSNIIKEDTKRRYLSIIDSQKEQGAEGIILGCTEIPLLIKPGDCDLPLFDTALIHSAAAVEFILS
jgi:aspartate racemase